MVYLDSHITGRMRSGDSMEFAVFQLLKCGGAPTNGDMKRTVCHSAESIESCLKLDHLLL